MGFDPGGALSNLACGNRPRTWQGRGVKLRGCDDREIASALIGADIAVRRTQFADDLVPGEYYWADLEGLKVVTLEGVDLGSLDRLLATGANDVMVVLGDRERLLPYIPGSVVQDVDLDARVMRVDWDPGFLKAWGEV